MVIELKFTFSFEFLFLCGWLCFLPATAFSEPHNDNAKSQLTLHLTDTNLLLARINDANLGMLNFMIDTGSDLSVINDDSIFKQGKSHVSSTVSRSIYGFGMNKPQKIRHKIHIELTDSQINLFTGEMKIANLNDLSNAYGTKIDGVLGWDILKHWCINIDFPHNELHLSNEAPCKFDTSNQKAYVIKSRWNSHGILLETTMKVNDKFSVYAALHFDTGNNGTIQLDSHYQRDEEFTKTLKNSEFVITGINGKTSFLQAQLNQVQFRSTENIEIKFNTDVPIFIAQPGSIKRPHAFLYKTNSMILLQDGSIGNAVLNHYKWLLNPKQRMVSIVLDEEKPGI